MAAFTAGTSGCTPSAFIVISTWVGRRHISISSYLHSHFFTHLHLPPLSIGRHCRKHLRRHGMAHSVGPRWTRRPTPRFTPHCRLPIPFQTHLSSRPALQMLSAPPATPPRSSQPASRTCNAPCQRVIDAHTPSSSHPSPPCTPLRHAHPDAHPHPFTPPRSTSLRLSTLRAYITHLQLSPPYAHPHPHQYSHLHCLLPA